MKQLIALLMLNVSWASALAAPSKASGAPDAIGGFSVGVEMAEAPLGANVVRTSDMGLDKWIGDEGVFATNPVTGSERFVPNANAPSLRKGPLTADAEEHNRLAVEYFTARGLPSDQIGFVQVLTHMASDGMMGESMQKKKASFEGYTTVVNRAIEGIGVPDSFAAIRFNRDGMPTMIWKYWPAIPRNVVDQAVALRSAAADRGQSTGLTARLPAELRSAASEVTIRHSDFDYDTSGAGFEAFASMDVHQERAGAVSRARTRHFDINGRELSLPNQRAAQSAATLDSVKSSYR